MSRLIAMQNKLKAVSQSELDTSRSQEIATFRVFYQTPYYVIFKKDIQKRLDTLNRARITDPSALVTAQGERNAYIAILDNLNTQEGRVNDLIRAER